jgi:alkanesulfonate monooxygenase
MSRPATPEYLAQIASEADQLCYIGALVPTGNVCEDAWVVASNLISCTQRLKFIVAVRPGHGSPGMAARMAATFGRMSGGRLIVNVVCGGNPDELAGGGVFLKHDERYNQASEWIDAWRKLVKGEETTIAGDYVALKNGKVMYPALQKPYPPLMCGASSSVGQKFAARWLRKSTR